MKAAGISLLAMMAGFGALALYHGDPRAPVNGPAVVVSEPVRPPWLRVAEEVPDFPPMGPYPPDIIGVMNGTCSELFLANKPLGCAPPGMMFTHFTNGRSMYSVTTPDDVVISFSGGKDGFVQPQLYELVVDIVRHGKAEDQGAIDVMGKCLINSSEDRSEMLDGQCMAVDVKGLEYSFKFKSDGTPGKFERLPTD